MNKLFFDSENVFRTREEFVTEQLRSAILKGRLNPGQKLDQNAIADTLQVSRSPVREAIRILSAEGLVEVYPHRAAIVAQLSAEEFEEIYSIRGLLEGRAARLAAPEMDTVRISALRGILDQLDTTSNLDKWLELNRRFHHTIYRAASRPRLLSIIENLRNTCAPYIRQFVTSGGRRATARTEHERIFKACADKDGLRAQEETQYHLQTVCQGVLAHMKQGFAS